MLPVTQFLTISYRISIDSDSAPRAMATAGACGTLKLTPLPSPPSPTLSPWRGAPRSRAICAGPCGFSDCTAAHFSHFLTAASAGTVGAPLGLGCLGCLGLACLRRRKVGAGVGIPGYRGDVRRDSRVWASRTVTTLRFVNPPQGRRTSHFAVPQRFAESLKPEPVTLGLQREGMQVGSDMRRTRRTCMFQERDQEKGASFRGAP